MKSTWRSYSINHTPWAIFEGKEGEVKLTKAEAKVFIETLLKNKGCYHLVSI